jgi:phosphate-selective porin OprO and OprP
MRLFYTLLLLCFSLIPWSGYSQTEVDERAMIRFDQGLGFHAPDTSFGVNLRFRMQNRIGFQTVSTDDLSVEQVEARIRRLRLRLDGYIKNQRITYYLQLSFSRSDQDWDGSKMPNIIRDAIVYYHFSPKFYVGFGQGKLPGNRQRIISSGQLQFVDRSIVNAGFNIDRDFGVMLYYSNAIAGIQYNLKGAVTSGEGRNALASDNGLAYTGRIELLPLGRFINNGDFSEGDLEFEPTPKISLSGGYSYNHKAQRVAGQRGNYMDEARNLKNIYGDFLFKYMGWAWFSEYMQRTTENPITFSGEEMVYVYTGEGFNTQLSFMFRNYWELAGKFSLIKPYKEIQNLAAETCEYTLGATRYYYQHKMKLQANISLMERDAIPEISDGRKFLNFLFQVELGI